jgi:YidC/Oxa1 family membrane protein insertase
MENKNTIFALVICFLILISGLWLQSKIWPTKPKDTTEVAEVKDADKEGKSSEAKPDDKKKPEDKKPEDKKPPDKKPDDKKPPVQAEKRVFVQMGDESFNSIYYLDNRGAAVRKVVLTRFQAADRIGNPEWLDKDKKVKKPLELILEEKNAANPSNLLFHFPLNSTATDVRPFDTLGIRNWRVVKLDGKPVEPNEPEEGKSYSEVEFETEIDGVLVSKVFTLKPDTYHLGLEVRLQRTERAPHGKLLFRYQLTSGHGLPIEGEWYTSTFMNALIGRVDIGKDDLVRDFQDLRYISHRAGGKEVVSDDTRVIRYGGVVTQFFASIIVVDNVDQPDQNFLKNARPTLETATAKGKLKSRNKEEGTFVVLLEKDNVDMTFQVAPGDWERLLLDDRATNGEIGVVYMTDSNDKNVVIDIRDPERTNAFPLNDITVRVATTPIELPEKGVVTQKYLLYNGPVKVRLLSHLDGDAAVNDALVDRYRDTLHLNTLTDYHFQGEGSIPAWFGENVSNRIYLTRLLISTTNIMHEVLTFLHRWIIPKYALCIILLTIMVRGMMFPLSRKQALMSLRMQELQPEIKKLQEKFKDDRQGLGLAQMELFRKHKVSPLGTCWVAFLQMPIFLGLYYCLQESIHFRLAPFLWIQNLAAPDMLFPWGESIPWISRPSWDGKNGMVYLGPFFNLLPVIAVAFMIVQQSMMAPPATDETQAMQQKMMKYMMIFFGIMFYKVAAGLCIYFIASSIWGYTERKLLPKRKKDGATPAPPPKPGFFQKAMNRLRGNSAAAPTTDGAATNGAAGGEPVLGARAKRKARAQRKESAGKDSAWQRLKDWWADVLKQASKR